MRTDKVFSYLNASLARAFFTPAPCGRFFAYEFRIWIKNGRLPSLCVVVSARRPRRLWSPRPPRCTRVRGDLPNPNCRKIGKFVLFQRKMSRGTNVRSFSVDSSGKIWYNYVERASKPCAAPACRPVNRQRGVGPARLGRLFARTRMPSLEGRRAVCRIK